MKKRYLSTIALLSCTALIGTSVLAVTAVPTTVNGAPDTSYNTPTPTHPSSAPINYDGANITYDLDHVISRNTDTSVWYEYHTTLCPESGYTISSVEVTYGGKVITPVQNSDGSYDISVYVDNNNYPLINIKASAVLAYTPTENLTYPPISVDGASVYYDLDHVISSNMTESVWTEYYTTLTPENGYEISYIKVICAEEEVTPVKNSDGSYSVTAYAKHETVYGPIGSKDYGIYVTARAIPSGSINTFSQPTTIRQDKTDPVTRPTTIIQDKTEPTIIPATTVPDNTTPAAVFTLGDVTNDGKINVKDCTYVQKAIAGYYKLTEIQNKAADVDGSGNVNIRDATEIQKYAVKRPSVLDKN